jgi:uncharacterized protein (TIGR02271 family)
MSHTLVAMFDDRQAAMNARQRLLSAGFSEAEVSVHAASAEHDRTSAATTGTTTDDGGIGGWFRSLFGLDDDDAQVRMHTEAARRGATMVSVDARDETTADRASDILRECGAIDLDERASQWDGDRGVTARGAGAHDDALEAGRTIPVVEEELAVGKRAVQRGGVRVFTRIVERPVEEQVRLREEHAEVVRRPVDRPATEADLAAAGGPIEIRESVEEAVVSKRAHVVEEVQVGKRVTERTETVRDTVRHTEVDVDAIGATEREHAVARDDEAQRVERERTGRRKG